MQRHGFLRTCAATSVLGALAVMPPAVAVESAAELPYDLTTQTGTIYATLLLPSVTGRVPVVLIIAGSGPTDRDGNAPTLALSIYRKLAQALVEHGIASVRFDKRGVAASHAAIAAEADIRFDSYVDDAAAWIAKLRADTRFSQVVLAGHSEGSLVGMIAAQRTHVDAFVSLEGAGFPASEVLQEQLRSQLAPYPELAAQTQKIIATLQNGATVTPVGLPPPLMSLFRPSVQPYLISWFKYDPRVEIAKLGGRVIVVQGTHDVQVPVADGKALAAADPNAKFVLIDNMTHVLADDPADTLAAQLTGAYADAARPLNGTLIRTLVMAAGAASY